jgi:hypothetical protein
VVSRAIGLSHAQLRDKKCQREYQQFESFIIIPLKEFMLLPVAIVQV